MTSRRDGSSILVRTRFEIDNTVYRGALRGRKRAPTLSLVVATFRISNVRQEILCVQRSHQSEMLAMIHENHI